MKPRKRRDCKKRDELMMKLQEGGQELRGRERESVRERHKGRKNTEEEAEKGSKTRERGRK